MALQTESLEFTTWEVTEEVLTNDDGNLYDRNSYHFFFHWFYHLTLSTSWWEGVRIFSCIRNPSTICLDKKPELLVYILEGLGLGATLNLFISLVCFPGHYSQAQIPHGDLSSKQWKRASLPSSSDKPGIPSLNGSMCTSCSSLCSPIFLRW